MPEFNFDGSPVSNSPPASPKNGSPATPEALQALVDQITPALSQICYVDSGIGGAMAANLVPGAVTQFGSYVCLPIGDKARYRAITYTAQMILEGLIGQNKNQIIIACNTASTTIDPALRVVEEFIRLQCDKPGESIYSAHSAHFGALQRFNHMIQQSPDYLKNHVHSIVEKTVIAACNQIRRLLINQDVVTVRIDSTNGTSKSKKYIEKMMINLTNLSDNESIRPLSGFSCAESSTFDFNLEPNAPTESSAINNLCMLFENKETEQLKRVLIQNRGNPLWVPAIEANAEDTFARLATESQSNADKLIMDCPKQDSAVIAFKKMFAEKVPDLTMLCCTHFPAMRAPLIELYRRLDAEKKFRFLSQDAITLDIVAQIVNQDGGSKVTAELLKDIRGDRRLDVILGDHTLTPEQRETTLRLLETILGREGINVSSLPEAQGQDYLNMHKEMSYLDAKFGSAEGSAFKELDEAAHIHTKWQQDKGNRDPQKRADAHLVAGISRFNTAQQSIATALNLFLVKNREARADPQVRRLFSALSLLGRLGTLGETRGIDILGVRYDPGQCLIEAAGMMAEIVKINSALAEAAVDAARGPASVAIVTGFTVVDDQGKKVCGENDGPPGAVMLANSLLSQRVPVTLVIDSGAESSLISALLAADLAQLQGVAVHPMERTVENITLREGLKIICIQHDQKAVPAPDSVLEVQRCIGILESRGTQLVIAIERPSPNVSDGMSSMSGASIKDFNADMSPLFDKRLVSWKTIGIGDGGNEIGTAGAQEAVVGALKPDGTPVVKKGDQIAATVKTDVMVLSSVSNNGGLSLSIAFELLLGALGQNRRAQAVHDGGESAAASPELFPTLADLYIHIILSMHDEDMSMDGVNKVNAVTVDGRRLLRGALADGTPLDPPQNRRHPGEEDATHQDMFDAMTDIIIKSGITLTTTGAYACNDARPLWSALSLSEEALGVLNEVGGRYPS